MGARAGVAFKLYLITDRRLVGDLPSSVERALSAIPHGAAAVQLREKDLGARALLKLGQALLPITRRHGSPLLINDRLDVARALGADGVHLTSGSVSVEDARAFLGAEALIGASCHSIAELQARGGADFATYSPIFPSPGKGPAIGTGALLEASRLGTPLFALGGIDAESAPAAMAAGARGVAAIRAWLGDDPAQATSRLWEAAPPPSLWLRHR